MLMLAPNIKPEASLLSIFQNMFSIVEGQSIADSFNGILVKIVAMLAVLL